MYVGRNVGGELSVSVVQAKFKAIARSKPKAKRYNNMFKVGTPCNDRLRLTCYSQPSRDWTQQGA